MTEVYADNPIPPYGAQATMLIYITHRITVFVNSLFI